MAYDCQADKNMYQEQYDILCTTTVTQETKLIVQLNYNLIEVSVYETINECEPGVFLKNQDLINLILRTFDPSHEIMFKTDIVSNEQVLKQANILYNLLKTYLIIHL